MRTEAIDDLNLLGMGLEQIGLALDDLQRNQFSRYIHEIELFNATYRLVGAQGHEFVVKHLLDSVAAVPVFNRMIANMHKEIRLCDVGSGAGLPGIPLAIMLPGIPIKLVERSGRRAGFLRNALAICNLHDRVEVIEKDLSEVDDRFDIVTFRAFHPLTDVIRPIGDILADGGFVCAYKGRREAIEEELAAVELLVKQGKGGSGTGWISSIEPLSVPYLEAERALCIMQKGV